MSTTKLDWVYQDRAMAPEYRAAYKGLVIRAIHDDCPGNPFEDQDSHWPMRVWCDQTWTAYDCGAGSYIKFPYSRFTDEALIHNQVHIARAFESTVADLIETYSPWEDDTPVKYSRDPRLLRDVFDEALGDHTVRRQLDILAELYTMLGIPCLRHTSRGRCQGDWAELLIVATPEAQQELRSRPEGMDDAAWAETLKADMENQAKLYDAWAWGDVYGFSIHRPVEDEDDAHTFGDMIGDALDSCWGFYGSDFVWSGLEDAAIEAAEQYVEENPPCAS